MLTLTNRNRKIATQKHTQQNNLVTKKKRQIKKKRQLEKSNPRTVQNIVPSHVTVIMVQHS